MQSYTFSVNSTSQRTISVVIYTDFKLSTASRYRTPYRAGALSRRCSLRSAPAAPPCPFRLLVFRAPEWFRCERLCPFAEERAPVRTGRRDPTVAIEEQRARSVTSVRKAEQ